MASPSSKTQGPVSVYQNNGVFQKPLQAFSLRVQTDSEEKNINALLVERIQLQRQLEEARRVQKEAQEEELAIRAKADAKRSAIKQEADAKRSAIKQEADAKRSAIKQEADAKRSTIKEEADAKRSAIKEGADAKRSAIKEGADAKRTAIKQEADEKQAVLNAQKANLTDGHNKAQREVINKAIQQILPRVLGVSAEVVQASLSKADIELFGCDLQKKCLIMTNEGSAEVLLKFARDHKEVQKCDLKICKEEINQQAVLVLLKAIDQTNISQISFARPLNEVEKNEALAAAKKVIVQGRKLTVESA